MSQKFLASPLAARACAPPFAVEDMLLYRELFWLCTVVFLLPIEYFLRKLEA